MSQSIWAPCHATVGCFKYLYTSNSSVNQHQIWRSRVSYIRTNGLIQLTRQRVKQSSLLESSERQLNASKSCCVYVGPRYNADLDDVTLGNAKINWNSSFKCLGIHFVNAKSICANIEHIRHNFFMYCNNILSHFSDLCDLVQLQMHEAYALSARTYATAAHTYLCYSGPHVLMLQQQLKYLKRR